MARPRGVDGAVRGAKIRAMRVLPAVIARVGLAALAITLAACERATPPAARRPTASSRAASAPAASPALSPPTWDSAAGPALLVRGSVFSTALVVLPQYTDSTLPDSLSADLATLRGDTLLLVARSGPAGHARVMTLGHSVATDDCVEWPGAAIEPTTDDRASVGWTVAFVGHRAEAIPLDSIEGLASADSAQLAAAITRLASSQPDDTSATFRGIPLVVRMAYRFTPAPHVVAVIADLVRNLNLEASPLEQHTLLVAERSDSADARYRVAYQARAAGVEDSVVTTEVLGAVRFAGSGAVGVVLMREGPDGIAYVLLERSAAGDWRVRWTSAHAGC